MFGSGPREQPNRVLLSLTGTTSRRRTALKAAGWRRRVCVLQRLNTISGHRNAQVRMPEGGGFLPPATWPFSPR
ncbi:MAG: hypothetical protein D6725_12310 [Planctomycetota bacterium]|nr:MAG: hypothetical protein D6725_12310 [Planctomycetota bacterium]